MFAGEQYFLVPETIYKIALIILCIEKRIPGVKVTIQT